MINKVLIAGYFGAGNAGDEAILESMLSDLRAHVPGLVPVVISVDPASTARDHDVQSVPNHEASAVMGAVKECEVVILGGGGLLQDYWDVSLAGLFSKSGAALSYFCYPALAALYNKPLILYAIGIGPLSTKKGGFYTRMASEYARMITVRDEASKVILQELGVDAEGVYVTADPAFRFAPSRPKLELAGPILGVALRNWSIGVSSDSWEAEIAAALDGFLHRHGGSILFLPFQRSRFEPDNDTAVAERVRSLMRESATIYEDAGLAGELAGVIGRCDIVLGMRYHSVLFAIRESIRVVGLVYDPKVRNLLDSVGCGDYALELGAVRADRVLSLLEGALADADLPGKLTSAVERLQTAAAETARLVGELLLDGVSHPPRPPMRRWWLDELSSEAAFAGDDAIKRSLAEARQGQDWPYDVICFPGIEWDFRWMRAQQLMSQFAGRGHRVFFVSVTTDQSPDAPKFSARAVQRNVWEVRLASPKALDVYSGLMDDDVRNSLVDGCSALAREFAINRAACVLHLSTWSPAASRLRCLFGWQLVYDCMDDWSGFAWMPERLLHEELALVENADLVVVSAQKLWDKWSVRNDATVLIRNAADLRHFQQESGIEGFEVPLSPPVVGFFGAIDSWFDVELVRHAASARPQYSFALIGAIYDERAETLRGLSNIKFFGHQPYEQLPAYLRGFDACIIPFKRNTVTQSTDPVKFYEYIAQGKPVVSTGLPELEIYRGVAYLAEDPEDFVRLLDAAIGEHDEELMKRRLEVAGENSWEARCDVFESAIERTFDAIERRSRILFAYQTLSLGGVEIVLQSRVAELTRRGCSICLVFMEELDGRPLFEGSGFDVRICPSESDLVKALTDFKPDWIVSIDTPLILTVAQRIAPGARLIYEVHTAYPHMLVPLTDRDLLMRVRGVIVPSVSQGERVRALMAIDKPIEVVPNPLSRIFCEAFEEKEIFSRPIILWVGRLDNLKRWAAFVEIANQIRDRTNAEFLMVSAGYAGDGTVELPEVLKSSGFGERFRSMRAVEHSAMPGIYHAVAQSGGCLVSTSTNESFGMAVLEAMACGCPVIVPDVVGLRDLVRHGETGFLYPAGETAAACREVMEVLTQPPERRRMVIEKAAKFVRGFSPERAADRFLAILADWSKPDAQESPIKTSREYLSRILASVPDETAVVIFPPSVSWDTVFADRGKLWARAFARCGCLVFYCDPQRLVESGGGFVQVEDRLFAVNAPLQVFSHIKGPLVIAGSSNLERISGFNAPRVLYDCQDRECAPAEWLASAKVVTVNCGDSLEAIVSHRPDAIVAPDELLSRDDFVLTILNKLKSADTDEPVRLKAQVKWLQRQVDILLKRIENRDRPTVEVLRDAVAELKHTLAERDKGIAFLRGEVAAREHSIAERSQRVKLLGDALLDRDAALAHLRDEIGSRDAIFKQHQEAMEFLQNEIDVRDAGAAAQIEGIAFLREEVGQREKAIAEQKRAMEFLQREIERIPALQEQLAQREIVIAERQRAIDFLRHDVAARDSGAAIQLEGISFLRQELAQREIVISDQRSAIEFLKNEVTALEAGASSQREGIAFLREESALRENRLCKSEAEVQRLRAVLLEAEERLR